MVKNLKKNYIVAIHKAGALGRWAGDNCHFANIRNIHMYYAKCDKLVRVSLFFT